MATWPDVAMYTKAYWMRSTEELKPFVWFTASPKVMTRQPANPLTPETRVGIGVCGEGQQTLTMMRNPHGQNPTFIDAVAVSI